MKETPSLKLFAAPLPYPFSTCGNGLFVVLCLAVFYMVMPQAAMAQAPAPPATDQEPTHEINLLQNFLKENGSENSFVYKRENRPDPFFPFLTKELMQAEVEAKEELAGMRKFEPGQLTLVAIVFSDDGPLAMVQDSAGKGYVLRKGTKIGRSGEVMDIAANLVVIKQLTYSLTREKRYKTIEMVLKEGEKQR